LDAGVPDGVKVDTEGNVYCTGPGGIWIFSVDGAHIETIEFPELPANCCFGDQNGKMLYVTARTGLYRIRVKVEGIRP
jgi:gluconolactonase